MISHERLKELLHYDPETGVLTWRAPRQGVRVGDAAGWVSNFGYRRIMIDGGRYMAHRLAWLYVHGEWPKDQIDHINGVRDDNRLINLREATNAENHQNLAMRPSNKSGFMGVSWDNRRRKWRSRIRTNRKLKHIGLFDTPEAAYAVYLAAKSEIHTFSPTVRESNYVVSQ